VKPAAVIEETKEKAAAVETKPIVEDTKPVVKKTKPVVEEIKSVVEETKPVAEENKPVVKETKPVVKKTKPVVEKTKPVVEETKEEVKPAKSEEKTVEDIKKVEVVEEEKKEEVPLTSGQLSLTLTKATLTRDTETFGKMDPYVGFEYNGVDYKTKVAEDMGKKPVWNEVCTVSFTFILYLDLQTWCKGYRSR
jgi:hypothetical protein